MQDRRLRDEERKIKKRAHELTAKSARMQDALKAFKAKEAHKFMLE
jgi:hypothetical protein